jgi:hypothetical protein
MRAGMQKKRVVDTAIKALITTTSPKYGQKKVHPERQTFEGEIRRRNQRNHAILSEWQVVVSSGEILRYE